MIKREKLSKLCREQIKVLSQYNSHRQRIIYVIALLGLVFLLLTPILFHHKTAVTNNKYHAPLNNRTNYHSALEANLAKLQQLQNNSIKVIKPLIAKPKHVAQRSKSYQLRQHAPTRVYNAGLSIITNATNHSASTLFDTSHYGHFSHDVSQSSVSLVVATKLLHPEFTIAQGELIHAVLETAIDSDLPGMIRAIVAHPVYAYISDRILIPAGSRLIGQYSSQTLQGINRIMVIWQRILLPNGISIQIGSPGSDTLGRAGFNANSVNTHFLQRFGEASLLSLLGAVSANLGTNDTDDDNAVQRYRTAITQSFQTSASRALKHTASIKPTLNIYQGASVTVFVARDLDFYKALNE